MKEFAVYTLSRIGLFVAAYALVAGVYLLVSGAGSVPILWPFVVAVLISAVASLFLRRGQRERFAAAVQRRAAKATQKFDAARAKEDDPDA